MSKQSVILRGLALMFILVATPAIQADDESQGPIESLLQHFIEAFNAGDFKTMETFYQQAASTSFNERRTEQEDRDLHQQITGMLGKLTLQKIEIKDPEGARLIVTASIPESTAEFHFKLVGDPPHIDGFSVGVPPDDMAGGHPSDAGPEADHAMPDNAAEEGPFEFLTSAKGVYQSQVFVQSDGSLLLVWVQKGLYDLDLFVARQNQGGKFSHPVRINQRGLNRYTGDEARPSVAIGPDGTVAVAWTAANMDIMLAVGSKFGDEFDPPLKLNQDEGQAYRTMPSLALSPDGSVHTIWLDPREAPEGMEEPSDLYYATVKNGVVRESNLTVNQESTVCGCCRPFIAIDDEARFDIAFRNASTGGYRDISRINGTIGSFSEPQPTSPPIWKLNACPSAGPIVSQGGTLWKDASTGSWRMLWSTDVSEAPAELFTDQDDLEFTYSPRTVSGREAWVLVGATPNGLIATWNDGSWQIVRDDLPRWVSSAAVRDGQLILVGNERGLLLTATLPL